MSAYSNRETDELVEYPTISGNDGYGMTERRLGYEVQHWKCSIFKRYHSEARTKMFASAQSFSQKPAKVLRAVSFRKIAVLASIGYPLLRASASAVDESMCNRLLIGSCIVCNLLDSGPHGVLRRYIRICYEAAARRCPTVGFFVKQNCHLLGSCVAAEVFRTCYLLARSEIPVLQIQLKDARN